MSGEAEFEFIIGRAVEGARDAVKSMFVVADEDLAIVVNIAWRSPGGEERAIGSAIPDCGISLLADSLAQSADEASELKERDDDE